LEKSRIRLRESAHVLQLRIENIGDADVFIQAGDVLKDGSIYQTLNFSLLLPPLSGQVPIASFCVPAGTVPSRKEMLEMMEEVRRQGEELSAPRNPPSKLLMSPSTLTPTVVFASIVCGLVEMGLAFARGF